MFVKINTVSYNYPQSVLLDNKINKKVLHVPEKDQKTAAECPKSRKLKTIRSFH